jgi:radical SAM protein with 4Fe4S-binding SPASM domain
MGRYANDFQFGKLGRDDLAELWVNHPSLQFIRNGIPTQLGGICGRCVMRWACLGCCRLENEYVTLKTLFEPYPLCATMEKLGRFPQGRAVARADAVAGSAT